MSRLQALRAPLSVDDFAALTAIKAQSYAFLPKSQIERLLQLGLIKERLAGLQLTEAGEIRVAAQK